MLRFLFLALLLTGFSRPAMALEASAAHAVFLKSADSSNLELYWEVNPVTLHYHKDTLGRLVARIRTQIRISNVAGVLYKDLYYLETKPFYEDAPAAPRVLEQQRIVVPHGRLTIELYLSEEGHPEGNFYHRDTLTVLPSAAPSYSTLQLLDTIIASPAQSIFLKNGYHQLPRSLNFYDEGQQRVHMYVELYRTSEVEPASFPLIQTIYLSKRKGERDLSNMSVTDTIRSGAPRHVFRHSFTTATLPSGNYYLNSSLRDIHGAELASGTTFFQTINKHPVEEKAVANTDTTLKIDQGKETYLDLSRTFVSKFTMPQLRAILKMLIPVCEPGEVSAIRNFLNKPDEVYMRYFIYNHFTSINKKDPEKAWYDFSNLVREVNKRFSSGGTMGYETDRGFIYLKYGEPAEEVRVPNEAGALPYEVWRYNVGRKIGGSGLFLFYSPGYMSSDFRLLHSTVPGERQNPDWRAVLYSTGHSSGNINARAEEFFGKQ
jgi:GWxTD domain-containing protein